jgi:DNA-binding NtrC family response regulator
MVHEGTFRSDLYFRLNVLTIEMPPLRARRDDIMALARHYALRTARRYGLETPTFTNDAREAMESYSWPGNVRELINIVERAVLLSGSPELSASSIGLAALHPGSPTDAVSPSLDGLTLDQAELMIITNALKRSAGNVSQAARALGVTRMALRYRLQKHGIDAKSLG